MNNINREVQNIFNNNINTLKNIIQATVLSVSMMTQQTVQAQPNDDCENFENIKDEMIQTIASFPDSRQQEKNDEMEFIKSYEKYCAQRNVIEKNMSINLEVPNLLLDTSTEESIKEKPFDPSLWK